MIPSIPFLDKNSLLSGGALVSEKLTISEESTVRIPVEDFSKRIPEVFHLFHQPQNQKKKQNKKISYTTAETQSMFHQNLLLIWRRKKRRNGRGDVRRCAKPLERKMKVELVFHLLLFFGDARANARQMRTDVDADGGSSRRKWRKHEIHGA